MRKDFFSTIILVKQRGFTPAPISAMSSVILSTSSEAASSRQKFSTSDGTPSVHVRKSQASVKLVRGFTLIEVMTAALITVLGLVGIYSLVVRTMNVSVSNADRFVAAQLAKEGIELVRNIRDCNVLAGESDWTSGLNTCFGAGCEMDYNDPGLVAFGDSNFYVDSNGFYNYDGSGQKTKYKRKIVITPNADTLDILVEIMGSVGSQPFRAYSQLYNWRK